MNTLMFIFLSTRQRSNSVIIADKNQIIDVLLIRKCTRIIFEMSSTELSSYSFKWYNDNNLNRKCSFIEDIFLRTLRLNILKHSYLKIVSFLYTLTGLVDTIKFILKQLQYAEYDEDTHASIFVTSTII